MPVLRQLEVHEVESIIEEYPCCVPDYVRDFFKVMAGEDLTHALGWLHGRTLLPDTRSAINTGLRMAGAEGGTV